MNRNFYKVIAGLAVIFAAHANAEVVTRVTTGEAIRPVPKEVKITAMDHQSIEGRTAMRDRLHMNGYDIAKSVFDAEYRIVIMKAGLAATIDGKKRLLDPSNLDEYKGLPIPPALSAATALDVAPGTGEAGRQRGVLDVDAGVITQGAALTGSGAGGLVVGVIGALVGMAVDGMAQNKAAEDMPEGVAVLKGRISRGRGKEATAVDVVIVAASDTETTPEALFSAIFDRYAKLVAEGYEPQPETPEAPSATVAQQ